MTVIPSCILFLSSMSFLLTTCFSFALPASSFFPSLFLFLFLFLIPLISSYSLLSSSLRPTFPRSHSLSSPAIHPSSSTSPPPPPTPSWGAFVHTVLTWVELQPSAIFFKSHFRLFLSFPALAPSAKNVLTTPVFSSPPLTLPFFLPTGRYY
ncbi:hypothetical protein BO99DRAFT_141110 [Aspergillus violaceofuscus CBS 115571]|uniref:Uncharacterized protein n=1 Tax=Aspergillus violaceofuscus (strain CBS 115571) TaxID=1450538 RepID=A0A2V5II03_ASPV1|nr:hypothetical protein BO99DRAFT_141110 [Aspergillus violaceofuscus CBS 115571]